ncbi:MAG: hypothetical protein AAFV29_10265, partial [Myxococcota bacterium]
IRTRVGGSKEGPRPPIKKINAPIAAKCKRGSFTQRVTETRRMWRAAYYASLRRSSRRARLDFGCLQTIKGLVCP